MHQELLDRVDQMARQGLPVQPEQQDRLVLQAQPVELAPQAQREQPEQMEQVGRLDQPVQQVLRAQPV